MAPSLVLVSPPVNKPSEPNLSGPAATQALRERGVGVLAIDASIGWFTHTLRKESLEQLATKAARYGGEALACHRRHIRSVTAPVPALKRADTYRSRKAYSSAIAHLDGALKLASTPWEGVRLRIADVDFEDLRAESRAALETLANRPGPFDAYFEDVLLPQIAGLQATHVGISLTFQNQAAAAVRLAAILRERMPRLVQILGGPLVACWLATGADLKGGAFALFDRVVAGSQGDLDALAVDLGGHELAAPGCGPLALDLAAMGWERYLSPLPVVPAAIGRGCYWRRCTFCPDHLHPAHAACSPTSLEDWLDSVAARFPGGAMLHLTDSALPPRHLDRIARHIATHRLPLRWHGFVRPEPIFARDEVAHRLAEGGCEMLQIGVESGSPRLLELMGKGADVTTMRRMLRAMRAAGIKNQVYLLFGLPTETDVEREQTLAFVEEEAEAISDINHALLNLPRRSPMHSRPGGFGITEVVPFHVQTDLSLYDDFRCGASHPRTEARRWLDHRFMKSAAVRAILGDLRAPFKANHACFLPHR